MFYLGGVGLAFFLTLLLATKRSKTVADKILTGWLFAITVHLLMYYFRKWMIYPQFLGADMPVPLMHGPFLYLYTRALTDRKLSTTTSLMHFIAPLAVLLYLIPFLSLPTERKIWVYEHEGVGYETFTQIRIIVTIASGVTYVVLSSWALRKHRLSIMQQFSSTEKINLQWLQFLIYWIGIIWLLVIFGNDDWVFAAAVLFILFIGFFGIRQVGIFHNAVPPPVVEKEVINKGESNLAIEENAEKRKYQKSGLTTDASESLHRNLTELMATAKPFRESELSLADLATRLNTQPNYLSQAINEREGKNFYDYINTLRIEEFMRLVASPGSRKYTLVALAEQCGFNSKSSFNRYFKKVTGKSPSDFLQTVSESGN